jgi:hypothetical protein
MAPQSMKPKFEHDCDDCVFLGHYLENDLYYCPKEPTILARYGADGPEYTSGLTFAEHDPRMAEAFRRAEQNGLLQIDDNNRWASTVRRLRGLHLPS